MSTRKFEISFSCLNDCIMQGCPSHKFIGEYSTVTDWLVIYDENKEKVFSGDKNKADVLVELIKILII